MLANLSTHAVHTLYALGVPQCDSNQCILLALAIFLFLHSLYPCKMRLYVARSLHLPFPDSASDILYIWRAEEYKPGYAAFFLKYLSVLTLALLAESLLNTIRKTKERKL